MDRDEQLMAEPNRVIGNVELAKLESSIMASVGEVLADAIGNDYHEPKTIENFSIESVNSFGQVTSKSLPAPTPEMRGDFVVVDGVVADENGNDVVTDIKIVCSGVAWYLVPPQLDVDYVLLAAAEIEDMQSYIPETDQ